MATAFFNPTSTFGNIDGWEVQSENPTTTLQRAQALGANGDEIASQTYDEKTSVSCEYVITGASAEIPKVGTIINGFHVDGVSVNFSNNDFVRMSLSGHKHGSINHDSCRTYTGTLPLISNMFGCPSNVCGVSVPVGVGVRSVSYSLQCNHVDELNGSGNFLAADNYDGTENVTVELCDTATMVAADGWTITSNGHSRGNTSAETSSISVEHHIQHDA